MNEELVESRVGRKDQALSGLRRHHKEGKRGDPNPTEKVRCPQNKNGPEIHSDKNRPLLWEVEAKTKTYS